MKALITLTTLMTILFTPACVLAAKFSIVKTGYAKSIQGLIYQDGSVFKAMDVNHCGFLIEDNGKHYLFETGLGENIDKQFSGDMPFWAKTLFAYTRTKSMKAQLNGKYKIEKVILSHTHWDHASGIKDLPSPTLISPQEEHEVKNIVANRTFPSQFNGATIETFKWTQESYLGFEKHFDVTGSGNVILVPLFGHTSGSLGLLLKSKNKKYFFVGDSIWTTRQLLPIQGKAHISSMLVDSDKEKTLASIRTIKRVQDEGYEIVPTHDFYLHEKLGYYPKWVE